MNHGWEKKRLGEVCSVKYGFPFDSKKFNSDGIGMPLIRIRDIIPGRTSTYYTGEFLDDYIIKKGDYLIGMDGEFNIARWNRENALLNQRVCQVTSVNNNVLLNQYLFYFLLIELKRIEEHTPFVTVKHLSAKTLNSIILPVPPMKVQEQIVGELDKLNELIELKRNQLKDLDTLAQSLFYETFGDPITNPKGWESVPFENCIIKIKYPLKLQTKDYLETGKYPIVSQEENLISGYTDLEDCIFEVTKPVIIFGDHTRIIKYIPFSFALGADGVKILKPIASIQSRYFYYCLILFKTPSLGYARHYRLLKEKTIPVPPIELQNEFAAKIEAIEEQKRLIESSITDLETLLASRMDYWFND